MSALAGPNKSGVGDGSKTDIKPTIFLSLCNSTTLLLLFLFLDHAWEERIKSISFQVG